MHCLVYNIIEAYEFTAPFYQDLDCIMTWRRGTEGEESPDGEILPR
jgi:hypothetical protein